MGFILATKDLSGVLMLVIPSCDSPFGTYGLERIEYGALDNFSDNIRVWPEPVPNRSYL